MPNFRVPDLPPEEKLSYIEAQKRKLVEYIKFLDDAAAEHHNEDLRPGSSHSKPTATSPPLQPSSSEPRRWSSGSFLGAIAPQLTTEDGYEAVDREDLPAGGVLASGVAGADEVTRRGWFGSWGGSRSASSSQPSPSSPH
jgi:hypothetical protein